MIRHFLSSSSKIFSPENQSSICLKNCDNSSGFDRSKEGVFFSPGFGIFLIDIEICGTLGTTIVPGTVLVLVAAVNIIFSCMGGKEICSETGCDGEELFLEMSGF